jgi:Domain of Unknown Function with PDB structure (DUF3857)/Transglutaminase-like superfamily
LDNLKSCINFVKHYYNTRNRGTISKTHSIIFLMKKTKHCALWVLCFWTITNAIAQKKVESKIKFGKLSDTETKMTVYDKDPAAVAVILFDIASLDYEMNREGGFTGTFKHHKRIKIFKKDGYGKANIALRHYREVFIQDLQAACYNLENGNWVETKLKPESVVSEKLSKNFYVQKFTIPQVREGSIIEYSYTMLDEKSGALPSDWSFQDDIPTIWSEYKVNMPELFRVMPTFQGIQTQAIAVREDTLQDRKETFGLTEVYWKNRVMRWAQKDLPALQSEPMMSSIYNYQLRVILEGVRFYKAKSQKEQNKMDFKDLVVDVWKQWGEKLLDDEDFGDLLKHKATSETVKSLVEGLTTDREKVMAIYQHIGKSYEEESYSSLYFTQPFKDFLKKHKGTPTELNLLAINMLRKAGVAAHPVLISTRKHGQLRSDYFPMSERINRVIAYLPSLDEKEPFLFDVTAFPQPLGLLPFEDLNGEGFALQNPNLWFPLKNKLHTKKLFFNTLTINEKGELSGTIAMTATGYEAGESRYYIHKDGAEKYANTLLKDLLVEGKLESHAFENTDNLDEKYLKGTFKIQSSAFVTQTDSQMYVSPLLFWAEKENLFKNPERKYEVDFGYPRENSYILNLTIPNGYKVETLPKSAKIHFEGGSFIFTYMTEMAGNQLKINVKWSIKKTIFTVEEYSALRNAYETILNKMAEQIVLSKI